MYIGKNLVDELINYGCGLAIFADGTLSLSSSLIASALLSIIIWTKLAMA